MALTGNSTVASDTASELLSAELALDCVAAVQATRKGKAREDAPRSDEDIAFELQATFLNKLVGVLQDHKFALSIDRAIETDTSQLQWFSLIDRLERDDHRAAVALWDGLELPQRTKPQRMADRHTSSTTEADWRDIESSMQNVQINTVPPATIEPQPTKAIEKGLECVICRDDVERRSFKAPCGHWYCRGCIRSLVETSLRDETLHPLRCCHRRLPLFGVFAFISTSLQRQFVAKSREFSVPAGSRMYCSNSRCSAFLGASGDQTRNVTCPSCGTISCSRCNDNTHPGEGCTDHRLTAELREIATVNKWQTCPGCHAIVELRFGCYHITCRCSAQFCYVCGARWKTCKCLQWDEERLLDDAERRVRNEFGNQMAEAQPALHAERVHQRMEVLRENHECQAHSWRYRHGGGQCDECGDYLRIYLMRCIHCQAIVCRRCSVNRL